MHCLTTTLFLLQSICLETSCMLFLLHPDAAMRWIYTTTRGRSRTAGEATDFVNWFLFYLLYVFTTISHLVDPYSNPYECWSSPFTSIPFPPYRIAWSEAVYLCPHPHKDTMCLPMVSPHNSSSGLPYGWHHGDTWFVNTTSPVGGPFPHHIGVPIVTTWYPNDMP